MKSKTKTKENKSKKIIELRKFLDLRAPQKKEKTN